ncbi:MAG: sulfite reductase subunit alpha [Lacipirellulaceae bacterium]
MSVSLIPESAPFTAEQRAWLNGFLAGWTGIQESVGGGVAAPPPAVGALAAPPADEESYCWHDPSLALDERLALADGKPIERRIMAAMAQLDCGACGYLCKTYSEAIASGAESNLTLCSPGGKETAKAVKALLKESPVAGAPSRTASPTVSASFSRANPYSAKIVSCENLNASGSSKQTTHAVISLGESGLAYEAGDSLGVYPTNCPELVESILQQMGWDENASLRNRLVAELNLRDATEELLELVASVATDANEAEEAARLVDSDEVDTLDVLDVLRLAPSARLDADRFADTLRPITPRLYSIASSLKAHPGEVHLTVGKAVHRGDARLYKGVASTMFADRVAWGDTVRVFVQPSHGFKVPTDPDSPMIMVGPGTGVAPFRAFLEERQAVGAAGKNWLFFGDQHAATDFLYAQEFNHMQAAGLLTRLTTAFSRDQEAKVYVQDRMREHGETLWEWLEEGASFYVCGDAKRMAADVDRALRDVVVRHGAMDDAQATTYVERLKQSGRYARDVY